MFVYMLALGQTDKKAQKNTGFSFQVLKAEEFKNQFTYTR